MFLAEMFGTMVLILLGDGVVANVVLNKTKGNSSGWIVITAGWGFAVFCGAMTSIALGGPGSLNPAGEIAGIVTGGNVAKAMMNIAGQFVGAGGGGEAIAKIVMLGRAELVQAVGPNMVVGEHQTVSRDK